MALFALPAAAGIFAIAPFLVPVVLGNQWLQAIPLMEVLAFNGALLLFHSSMCAVLIGRGFPANVTLVNAGYTLILVALMAIWIQAAGVVGAAYAAVATSLLSTPLYLYQIRKCLGIKPSAFLSGIARPLFAAALMAIFVRAVLPPLDAAAPFMTMTTWLVTGVLLGVVSYVGCAVAAWFLAGRPEGAERIVLDRVRSIVSSRFGSRLAARRD
jgi:O-antigen/teichoic acid export membrane protein